MIIIHRNQLPERLYSKIKSSKDSASEILKMVRFGKDKEILNSILADLEKASLKSKIIMERLENKQRKFWS